MAKITLNIPDDLYPGLLDAFAMVRAPRADKETNAKELIEEFVRNIYVGFMDAQIVSQVEGSARDEKGDRKQNARIGAGKIKTQ